jgi:hypothetical protein
MLKELPVPAVSGVPVAAHVTPSKTNEPGRSQARIHQQQQQQLHKKQQKHEPATDESLVDTGTPSKVAHGHDFR